MSGFQMMAASLVRVRCPGQRTAWKNLNGMALATLKALQLVHFFQGPLTRKELTNVILGSFQAATKS